MSLYVAGLFLVAFLSGGIAALSGFGIGSLLTPYLALFLPTKLAVAAVSIPHLAATALRFSRLRGHVDRNVLVQFGILSAVGGLAGAALHAAWESDVLRIVFGCLLVFAGVSGLTGILARARLSRSAAGAAGLLSGAFGGLVGNQGGIRAAALLAFPLSRDAFVATSTAVGLVVDFARMPIYFVTDGRALLDAAFPIGIMLGGVVAGTLWGGKLLRVIPEAWYPRVVSALIGLLGVYVLARPTG